MKAAWAVSCDESLILEVIAKTFQESTMALETSAFCCSDLAPFSPVLNQLGPPSSGVANFCTSSASRRVFGHAISSFFRPAPLILPPHPRPPEDSPSGSPPQRPRCSSSKFRCTGGPSTSQSTAVYFFIQVVFHDLVVLDARPHRPKVRLAPRYLWGVCTCGTKSSRCVDCAEVVAPTPTLKIFSTQVCTFPVCLGCAHLSDSGRLGICLSRGRRGPQRRRATCGRGTFVIWASLSCLSRVWPRLRGATV